MADVYGSFSPSGLLVTVILRGSAHGQNARKPAHLSSSISKYLLISLPSSHFLWPLCVSFTPTNMLSIPVTLFALCPTCSQTHYITVRLTLGNQKTVHLKETAEIITSRGHSMWPWILEQSYLQGPRGLGTTVLLITCVTLVTSLAVSLDINFHIFKTGLTILILVLKGWHEMLWILFWVLYNYLFYLSITMQITVYSQGGSGFQDILFYWDHIAPGEDMSPASLAW